VIVSGVVFIFALSGCASKNKDIELTDTEKDKVVEIGEKSANFLFKNIKGELQKALIKEGPYAAVNVCSARALKITKKVEKALNHGIKIKRTSLKYRNPKNAPDKYELEALKYFENYYRENKRLPDYYIQTVKEGSKVYYRYYKPLKVGSLCLTCHGTGIDPMLKKIIKEKYPHDRATGYKLGDFRGVIRVSIPAKMIKERKEKFIFPFIKLK
jgi:hypothetical protein